MKYQALNPILPGWEYIPDGEPHVFGDRVYLYGSHDRFNGDDYCQNNYVCWSAPINDLSDWTFHGEIFDVSTDPLNTTGKICGYAPDCCRGPDGRYYLYYALNNHTAMSVAVCDTPAGNFRFLSHMKTQNGRVYGTAEGDAYIFDPAVIVDDDGRAHMYMGFSPTCYMGELSEILKKFRTEGCHYLELCEDMVTVKTEPVLIVPGVNKAKGTSFEGHAFFEAPSIRKLFCKYYFVYSSEHFQELCYAVSDSPSGPFEYKGRLVSNGDIGINGNNTPLNHIGNNHGGILNIGNDYYIFYHRHTNNTAYSRQACAEKLTLTDDNTFLQSELTSCGLNCGPLKAEGKYSATIACNISCDMVSPPYITQSGVDREENDDQYIKGITNGAFVGFKYFNFKGTENISVTVKSTETAVIEVSADISFNKVCYINIEASYSPTVFELKEPLNYNGIKPLFFRYKGNGTCDFYSFNFS